MQKRLIAILCIALAATLALPACQLTPDAAAQVAVLEEQRAAYVEARDQAREDAAALTEQLDALTAAVADAKAELAAVETAFVAAREAGAEAEELIELEESVWAARDDANAAEAAQLATVAQTMARLDGLASAFEEAQAGVDATTAEIAQIETADLAKQAEGATAPWLPIVPVEYRKPLLALVGIGTYVANKRSRQHLATALRDFNPLDGDFAPGQALIAVARALGLEHSSEDPRVLYEIALRKARSQGIELPAVGEQLPPQAPPEAA